MGLREINSKQPTITTTKIYLQASQIVHLDPIHLRLVSQPPQHLADSKGRKSLSTLFFLSSL